MADLPPWEQAKKEASDPTAGASAPPWEQAKREIGSSGMGWGEWGADVAKSAAIGPVKGLIAGAGTPGDVRELAAAGVDNAGEYLGFDPAPVKKAAGALSMLSPITSAMRSAPTSKDITGAVEKQTGELYKPKSATGKYAQSVGEFLGNPATYAGPGGLASKVIAGTGGALGSEAAGQFTGDNPWAKFGGAVVGGLAPGIAARVRSPLPMEPERQRYIDVLKKEGIEDLSAGQETGRTKLRYLEGHLGEAPLASNRARDLMRKQQEDFTAAILRRVDEDAKYATPEVLNRVATRIGKEFDDLSARTNARRDTEFYTDLGNIFETYRKNSLGGVTKPGLTEAMDGLIQGLVTSAEMTGKQYKTARTQLREMRDGASGDNAYQRAISETIEAMDNMMERTLVAKGSPDVGAWQTARDRYRNLLIIEEAASGRGEIGAPGTITPAKLIQGIESIAGKRSYRRERDDFSELARAGAAVLSPLPQSGTAPRSLAGAGATKLLATGVEGTAIMSPAVQNWLKNQTFAGVERPGALETALKSISQTGAVRQ